MAGEGQRSLPPEPGGSVSTHLLSRCLAGPAPDPPSSPGLVSLAQPPPGSRYSSPKGPALQCLGVVKLVEMATDCFLAMASSLFNRHLQVSVGEEKGRPPSPSEGEEVTVLESLERSLLPALGLT